MKLDTSVIEGYEGMTAEEKVAALEALEMAEPEVIKDDSEITKLKGLLSKKNSELADITKQLRAKQTDEEAKEAERAQAEAAKDARIAELERKQSLADYTAKYLAIGFDAEQAGTQAEAFLNGDMEAVFANHQAHIEKIKKSAVAEAMTGSKLTPGTPPERGADDAALRRAWGLSY